MSRAIRMSLLIIFAVAFILPEAAFPDVKISLRNGRDIIADNCREAGAKLICEKMGGIFEIEKKDIVHLKGVVIKRKQKDESPEAGSPFSGEPAAAEQAASATPEPAKEPESGKPEAGNIGQQRTGSAAEEKRLGDINTRKQQLTAEREALHKEREELHEEIRNAGVIWSKEQLEDLKKRMADVDEKINRFNEEVKRLNMEEAQIIENINRG
jgi:hypothetical protein